MKNKMETDCKIHLCNLCAVISFLAIFGSMGEFEMGNTSALGMILKLILFFVLFLFFLNESMKQSEK